MRPWKSVSNGKLSIRENTRWRLHTTRLESFVSNVLALNDLFEDAHEKHQGDFIFDRYYTETVVELALERLDAMLFDASILGISSTRLDEQLQRCHGIARSLHQSALDDRGGDGGREADEPEIRHLKRVLSWMKGPTSPGECSVEALMAQTVDELFETLRRGEPRIKKSDLRVLSLPGNAVMQILDLGGGLASRGEEEKFSLADIRCEPLGLLLTKVREEGTSAEGQWLAVIDRFHLSLRLEPDDPSLFLETRRSGRQSRDLLFVYETGHHALPEGATYGSQRTAEGRFIWQAGCDDEFLEPLIELGGSLLLGD